MELSSANGGNYYQLDKLLAAKKWQEADEETAKMLLKVANREKAGKLRLEDIDNFPCEDLRIIDQLWLKYSNGRFGFSVQKQIYQSLGGTRDYNKEIWEAFADIVGWRVNGKWHWLYSLNLNFNLQSPDGHLPSCRCGSSFWYLFWVGGVVGFGDLCSRVDTCKL
ncbi:MAG: GUN4 domain-containing protein [Crinalium sp.]